MKMNNAPCPDSKTSKIAKRGPGRPAFSSEKRAGLVALGVWIRSQREALSLTQTQVANDLGVTKASVSLWEKGSRKPPLDRLMLILGDY